MGHEVLAVRRRAEPPLELMRKGEHRQFRIGIRAVGLAMREPIVGLEIRCLEGALAWSVARGLLQLLVVVVDDLVPDLAIVLRGLAGALPRLDRRAAHPDALRDGHRHPEPALEPTITEAVLPPVGGPDVAVAAGHMDDSRRAGGLPHERQQALHEEEMAEIVHLEGDLVTVLRGLACLPCARGVYEQAQPPDVLLVTLGEAPHGGQAVEPQRKDRGRGRRRRGGKPASLCAPPVGRLLQCPEGLLRLRASRGAASQGNVGAALGEELGHMEADAAATAGDERTHALQVTIEVNSLHRWPHEEVADGLQDISEHKRDDNPDPADLAAPLFACLLQLLFLALFFLARLSFSIKLLLGFFLLTLACPGRLPLRGLRHQALQGVHGWQKRQGRGGGRRGHSDSGLFVYGCIAPAKRLAAAAAAASDRSAPPRRRRGASKLAGGSRQLAFVAVLLAFVLPPHLAQAKNKKYSQVQKVHWKRENECLKTACKGIHADESEDCVAQCVSPACHAEVYGEDRLEPGEIDRTRSSRFNGCVRQEMADERKADAADRR
mmetsp:Transcript_22414/g.64369  ORF Transcript_22414/g.64369 Transcript_22414/m.64369 type:complete len:549 (+) Transcript_22414:442-2088(+)